MLLLHPPLLLLLLLSPPPLLLPLSHRLSTQGAHGHFRAALLLLPAGAAQPGQAPKGGGVAVTYGMGVRQAVRLGACMRQEVYMTARGCQW